MGLFLSKAYYGAAESYSYESFLQRQGLARSVPVAFRVHYETSSQCPPRLELRVDPLEKRLQIAPPPSPHKVPHRIV